MLGDGPQVPKVPKVPHRVGSRAGEEKFAGLEARRIWAAEQRQIHGDFLGFDRDLMEKP